MKTDVLRFWWLEDVELEGTEAKANVREEWASVERKDLRSKYVSGFQYADLVLEL
jgi:hypothetical protein